MGDLLYKVNARDPLAFAIALSILIAVAVIACLIPARRAARIDPARALRT
jgi:ABC-type antimicrobial peptide transport system permease subunit